MKTKFFDRFEKYYNEEMEPGEKASFEESLSKDPELNAAFKDYLGIYEALGDKETLDLRIKLREIRDEAARDRNKPDFFRHSYNWLWMAALITIILSFTVIVSVLIAKVDTTEQFAAGLDTVDIQKYNALERELMRFEKRNIEFNLYSPSGTLFFDRQDPLLFRWSVASTNPLILELINWEGKIVFSSGKPVVSPYIVTKKLPPGIMVYRFRTDTEAYFIGFLFLK